MPHPTLVAACPDETVLGGGAAFYLMQAVDGFNPTVELPALHAVTRRCATGWVWPRSTQWPRWARSTTKRSVCPTSAGPTASSNARCPGGWDELESYARHEGYPGPDIPGLDEVATWLEVNRPGTFTAGDLAR